MRPSRYQILVVVNSLMRKMSESQGPNIAETAKCIFLIGTVVPPYPLIQLPPFTMPPTKKIGSL
jgi:hypothetical protein